MMTPDLQLLLVRHGKAEANRPWVFLGRTDSPLSDEGRAQAKALAATLDATRLDAIYTSPLQRARQTAVILAQFHALTPITDARLVEQDYGRWEGLSLDEVTTRFPEDVTAWQQDARQYGPTEGENLDQVSTRVRSFCADVRRRHHAGTLLVVAHGSLLNALLCTLLGTSPAWLWTYRLDTARVSEVHLLGDRATLVRLNGR